MAKDIRNMTTKVIFPTNSRKRGILLKIIWPTAGAVYERENLHFILYDSICSNQRSSMNNQFSRASNSSKPPLFWKIAERLQGTLHAHKNIYGSMFICFLREIIKYRTYVSQRCFCISYSHISTLLTSVCSLDIRRTCKPAILRILEPFLYMRYLPMFRI